MENKLFAFFGMDLNLVTQNPMTNFYKVLNYCKDYKSFKITKNEFMLFVNNPFVIGYWETYNSALIAKGESSYDILFMEDNYEPKIYFIKFLGVYWHVVPNYRQGDVFRDELKQKPEER